MSTPFRSGANFVKVLGEEVAKCDRQAIAAGRAAGGTWLDGGGDRRRRDDVGGRLSGERAYAMALATY